MILQGWDDWSEIELLAGLMIGESRGEPRVGKIGVGLTARTRVEHPRWWGKSWREVILKCAKRKDGRIIAQFSCWTDHNADAILAEQCDKTKLWASMLDLAEYVYSGDAIDFIGKPTHYHAATCFPDWASGMKKLMIIGKHVFYRDTKEIA